MRFPWQKVPVKSHEPMIELLATMHEVLTLLNLIAKAIRKTDERVKVLERTALDIPKKQDVLIKLFMDYAEKVLAMTSSTKS